MNEPRQLPALKAARTIVVLRTDAIGDNVLGSVLLQPLRAAFPKARIVYACQDRVSDLFTHCPYVDQIVTFSRGRAYADEAYREEISRQLAGVRADVLLNPVFTREPLADALTLGSGAKVRIGFAGPCAPGCRDEAYTMLLPRGTEWAEELSRAGQFLQAIGMAGNCGGPRLWLAVEDQTFAREILDRDGFDTTGGTRTVILFAGALAEYRVNRHVGAALGEVFADGGINIISVGAAQEYALHQELLHDFPGRHLNLCGRTTIRQTAALLERARLAVGAETGAAHLACAAGTANVVILGGGHFGRFMPWSALTTAVSLPLDCFRCDWSCRYARAHCVVDIKAGAIAQGIRVALAGGARKPRLIVQKQYEGAGGPVVADVRRFIDETRVEIIEAAPAQAALPRSTPTQVKLGKDNGGGNISLLIRADGDQPPAPASETIHYLWTPKEDWSADGWNRAIDQARGEYLALVNNLGDVAALWTLADALEKNPQCVLAYAAAAEFNREKLFAANLIGTPVLWRRRAHRDIGYFDAAMGTAAPYEFWLRLAVRWPFAAVCGLAGGAVRNGTLEPYEYRVARERHWRKEWGPSPSGATRAATFENLARRIRTLRPGARIGLFGAGQHTRRFLDEFKRAIEPHAHLAVILDDRAATGEINGIPLARAAEWPTHDLDGIVISSDTYEQALMERAKALTNQALPVLSVYRSELSHFPAATGTARPAAIRH